MADLGITAASVLKTSDTVIMQGIAGATVTAGQPVYKDSTASNTLKPCDADALASSVCVGIALHGAASGQPLKYAAGGNLTINAVATKGVPYYVSTTAGGICPYGDLAAGDYVTFLGIATSTTNLKLGITSSSATI